MGIDIGCFSRVERIKGRHSDERCAEDEHFNTGGFRTWLNGKKPGCYISKGKKFGFYASYALYDEWINELAWIMLGCSAHDALINRVEYKKQPFFELMTITPGGDWGIGPVTSAKLFEDFARNATKAKREFQAFAADSKKQRISRLRRQKKSAAASSASRVLTRLGFSTGADPWPWEAKWKLYRDWRRGTRIASDDGLVCFYG